MASKFKAKQQAKREALCQKLVANFLPGLQESDAANFQLAYNFAAHNLAQPALSVNCHDADAWFDSLLRRCELDSQRAKAVRIRALVLEIKSLGLKGDYPDREARILQLLKGLAERPLDSSPERAAALVRQVRDQRLEAEQAAIGERIRHEAELLALIRSECSSPEDEEEGGVAVSSGYGGGRYGSSSSLSDWSEEEEEERRGARNLGGPRKPIGMAAGGRGNTAATPLPPTPHGPGGGYLVAHGGPQAASTPQPAIPTIISPREPASQLQPQTMLPWALISQPPPQWLPPDPPPSAGRPRLPSRKLLAPPGSLRSRLVAAAGLPWRVAGAVTPLPRVLLALLAALQGRSSEEVPWNPVTCSFEPRDDLYVTADVSFGTVRSAVRPVFRAATAIRRLDDWVRTCLRRNTPGQQQPHQSSSNSGSSSGITTTSAAVAAGRKPPQGQVPPAAAGGSSTCATAESNGGLEIPAWLLEMAGCRAQGQQRAPPRLMLVQGPTLQALHQAVSSCLHALRTPLIELEQRITSAAATQGAGMAGGRNRQQGTQDVSAPVLYSLQELLLSCHPFLRRAAGLVSVYLEVAKPLVGQLAAAPPMAVAAPAAASGGGGDIGLTPRMRAGLLGAAGASMGPAAAPAGGSGRSVALQLQAGLVLERLHAMNERGWLGGVFWALESHAHRCMLLYLYLSALEPLMDGLTEWLWTSGSLGAAAGAGGPTGGGAGGAGAAGSSSSSGQGLPADFFIVRGGGPGREVPPDHPSFWREGYTTLTRANFQPQQPAAAAAAPAGTTAAAAAEVPLTSRYSVSSLPSSAATSASTAASVSVLTVVGGGGGSSYLCPPFLEPLVPIIMAAGKSLRLRQREADSMDAAETFTAGAAGPGYASAGSAVLDLVTLEESYALYGLNPDYDNPVYGVGSSWGSGGRDLKRGLMERLISYMTSSTILGSGQHAEPRYDAWASVGGGGDVGLRGAVSSPAAAATWQHQMQDSPRYAAHVGTGPFAAAAAPPVVGGVDGTAAAHVASAAGEFGSSGAGVADGRVATSSGLWIRMATASSRLQALCSGETVEEGGWSFHVTGPPSGDSAGGGYNDVRSGKLAGATTLRVRAPPSALAGVVTAVVAEGMSSPVTPLDCGSLGGVGSPGEEMAFRRQQQQPSDPRFSKPGRGAGAGGDGDGSGYEGASSGGNGWRQVDEQQLGGWWPRRCELLLRHSTAGIPAAWTGGSYSFAARSGCGGYGTTPRLQAGPWHRIHHQLQAGPRAALVAAAGARAIVSGASYSSRPWCFSPSAGAFRAHQHPAMDLLLMHACGRVPTADRSPGCAPLPYDADADGGDRGGDSGELLGLPHPQELLRLGLFEPLQDRAFHVNDALILKLTSGWGLEARLMALPSVFLLSSPAVRGWADRLVSALLVGHRLGEPPLEEHQLESWLQEALASAGPEDVLPSPTSLGLSLKPTAGQEGMVVGAGGSAASGASGRTAATNPGAAGRPQQELAKFQAVQELDRSVLELERLELGIAPSWVVALIADGRVLRAYSQALVFMLQLRWVRAALDGAHKSWCLSWREQQMRAHPNSWRPLRSGAGAAVEGGGVAGRPPPLQRTVSTGLTDNAPATAAAAATGAIRSSHSCGSLLAGPSAVGGRNAAAAAAAASGGSSSAGGPSSSASSGSVYARLQSSLASMVHFMATLEQWVATQLVHDAWVELMRDLNSSRNLDDVCDAHTAYSVTLLRRCFRYSGEEASRHMGAALRKCLDACLRFAAALCSSTSGGAPPAATPVAAVAAAGAAAGGSRGSVLPHPLAARLQEEALHSAQQFSYWLGYLVRYVSTRALLSPSSDLGDLLMRLNYNECYSAHFMPKEVVAQQLAGQHCATAAARGWAALGPGPNPHSGVAAATAGAAAGFAPWHGNVATVGATGVPPLPLQRAGLGAGQTGPGSSRSGSGSGQGQGQVGGTTARTTPRSYGVAGTGAGAGR